MAWTWVTIGGALVLGFCLGVTLMSLMVIARDSGSKGARAISALPGPEGKTMLNRGRLAPAVGSAVRAGGLRKTFSVENPIPANDLREEFDPRTGGVCQGG